MRMLAAVCVLCLLTASPLAEACGTRLPEIQQRIDAEELAKLKTLTIEAAAEADLVIVGTVTSLVRPVLGGTQPGTVTLAVSETLKGTHAPTRTLPWQEATTLSCVESDSFRNVGFRDGGYFIVYVKEGRVMRSKAADALGESSLLKPSQEQALVLSQASE